MSWEGKFLRVSVKAGYECVERVNARAVVAIAALTDQERIVLVKQFRPALGKFVIELPAGLVGDEENKDEGILEAAERELLEETGYQASKFAIAQTLASSPGMTNEEVTYVIASGLSRKALPELGISVWEIHTSELLKWLDQQTDIGVAVSAKVLAGAYLLG